jgi:hypothetical protein
MNIRKLGCPGEGTHRKRVANEQANFSLDNTAWDRLAQLQRPVLIIGGDPALREQIGDELFRLGGVARAA